MRRRDFIKAMAAASVSAPSLLAQQQQAAPAVVAPATPPAAPPAAPTAPGPVPWMSGLREINELHIDQVVPDAVAQTNAHFFTEREAATLRRLSELMVPPHKGYPGALQAGAPVFLDFLIGASPADKQQMYRSGLDRLDAEARQKFGNAFAEMDAGQADELLRPWMRAWMTDHPPTEPYAQFINLAHSDIRTATVNSQAWSEAAAAEGEKEPNVGLYWFPVDPDLRHERATGARPSMNRQTPVRHS
jgi:hypothetical protein